MMKTRTCTIASTIALAAATTVATAPAHAAPIPPVAPSAAPTTGVVHYDTVGNGFSAGSADGSLENQFAQAGLVLLAGVGVSVALAVSAGVAGGAFELPAFPGLPF